MSDPVAAKSSFLCMYMSNHPDTLVCYVRHWGKIKEKVTSAQMTGIDTKGMSLTYTTKGGQNQIRIPFQPPLAGYEEVKPRLLQMKVDAEEALGMAKVPQISSFYLTPEVWKSSVLIIPLLLVTFLPGPTSPLYSPASYPAEAVRAWLGATYLKYIWIFMLGSHSLESLYTLSLCRKHGTGFFATVLYVLATCTWGFPIFSDFRKRVQAARIDSILKGQ